MKITEKSPLLLTGSRESSQHGMNSKHSVLLNNSPPQGKLFCKSQIHLGFYQSLTNLGERKYSSPAPYSLPISVYDNRIHLVSQRKHLSIVLDSKIFPRSVSKPSPNPVTFKHFLPPWPQPSLIHHHLMLGLLQ